MGTCSCRKVRALASQAEPCGLNAASRRLHREPTSPTGDLRVISISPLPPLRGGRCPVGTEGGPAVPRTSTPAQKPGPTPGLTAAHTEWSAESDRKSLPPRGSCRAATEGEAHRSQHSPSSLTPLISRHRSPFDLIGDHPILRSFAMTDLASRLLKKSGNPPIPPSPANSVIPAQAGIHSPYLAKTGFPPSRE